MAQISVPDQSPPPYDEPYDEGVSVDKCKTHLKLLESFYNIRQKVQETDGLFGLYNSMKLGEADDGVDVVKEKRWSLYVTRAADRFESWWQKVVIAQFSDTRATIRRSDMKRSEFELWPRTQIGMAFPHTMLPPLDVLMAWHCYMLNPRNYLEDCMRNGLGSFWATGLPWTLVDVSINEESFVYAPPEECIEAFENVTGHKWDNLEDSMTKKLTCFSCKHEMEILWASNSEEKPTGSTGDFGRSDFIVRCTKCRGLINHDVMAVQKFKRDVQRLILEDCPMPGTVLRVTTGLPIVFESQFDNNHELDLSNRIIEAHLVTEINDVATIDRNTPKGMAEVRRAIEETLRSSRISDLTKFRRRMILSPGERASIKVMMSRYWDNFSIFGLNIASAIVRQASFVEKMHKIDWIHSPTVDSTMNNLIEKYYNFFQIMAQHANKVAVPTLDVDLAWHTHQLSPDLYFNYSYTTTKKFINHDDKIDEVMLSDAFEWTSKQYAKMFGKEYSECLCWYCEAIREHNRPSITLFKRSVKSAADDFYATAFKDKAMLDVLCNPERTAHISSHSAIRSPNVSIAQRARLMGRIEALSSKAQARAAKNKRPVPIRRNSISGSPAIGSSRSASSNLLYGGFGYPYYYPFMMYPYYAPFYIGMPGCMAMAGNVGGCVAGACGNMMTGACGNGGCGNAGGFGSCGGVGGSMCGANGGGFSNCGGGGFGGGGCGGGGGGCGGGGN